MDTIGEIVSAGLDYISLTMLNNNPNVVMWEEAALAYLQSLSGVLGDMQLTRRLGYEGLSIGGSFVGKRERDTVAIFSGERAKPAYPLLYRRDTHVSRVDVQVSFQYRTTTANVAQVARDAVERDNRKVSSARQRNATLIEDLRSGSTCYVGQKTSEQFARIYNKEAESGKSEYARVWRYEVQLKNKLAVKLCEQLATGIYKPEAHAITFVKQWLRHRGVSTPWKAEAELLPLPKIERDPTENEQKLHWLRTQVRPALRTLLKYGLRDAILEALGLEDSPTR